MEPIIYNKYTKSWEWYGIQLKYWAWLIVAAFLLLFTKCASADNVLVLTQSYAGAAENVAARLTAAGHTVTISSTEPTTTGAISNYQQIWDVRYNAGTPSTATQEVYRSFVQTGGFLYMTAENASCCADRNGRIAAIITAAGGGSTTINYVPSMPGNQQTTNSTYVTAGTTVTYAAASSINNSQGTWLTRDSSNIVSAMLWIGNAGDLGTGYTGTILVVSDINWTDNSYFTTGNRIALDDYISGFVAGTVGGTISSGGNGSAGGGSSPTYCCGGSDAAFSANASFANRATVWSQIGGNKVIIEQIGNYNAATLTQSGNKNYAEIRINGSNNTSTVHQTSNSSTTVNYIESYTTGSNNTQDLTQSSTGGSKGIYINTTNNSNSITVNQTDAGNHYAEITISGSNKTVDVTQQGSAGHMAKIELTGGTTAITTTQTGSTQQFYSITHNCAQASCAAITVTQGQ